MQLEGPIGLDYLPAVCHPPGIGRYGRELVRALVRLEECPPLRLHEVGGGERVMDGAPLGLDVPGSPVQRRLQRRWPRRAVDLLGKVGLGADRMLGGVQLFHRLLPYHPPISSSPCVLPVPELPPAGSPEDQRLGKVLREHAAVFVFSEAYEREVQARHDLDPSAVLRVHVGCEHWVRDLSSAGVGPEVSSSSDSSGPGRILVLGAIRSARHPLAVLDAFAELRRGGLEAELVFCGRPGDVAESLAQRLEGDAGVSWIDEPREADMPRLVAGSSVLLHLASEEGTPVTPLESFAMGLEVVCDPLPAFREALGEKAHYCEDREPGTVAGQLEAALARAALARAGEVGPREERVRLASEYTWERTARETLDGWRATLARLPGKA